MTLCGESFNHNQQFLLNPRTAINWTAGHNRINKINTNRSTRHYMT